MPDAPTNGSPYGNWPPGTTPAEMLGVKPLRGRDRAMASWKRWLSSWNLATGGEGDYGHDDMRAAYLAGWERRDEA